MKCLIFCVLSFFVPVFESCTSVDEEDNNICVVGKVCISPYAWTKVVEEYSVTDIVDKVLEDEWNSMRYLVKDGYSVLFFKASPKELVAVNSESGGIRYVYNPLISNRLLDASSSELGIDEKERIGERVISALAKYQCEYGERLSRKSLKQQVENMRKHKELEENEEG